MSTNRGTTHSRAMFTRPRFKLTIVVVSLGMFCQGAFAQKDSAETDSLKADISTLKRDINTLEEDLRNITDQLNNLKRSFPSSISAHSVLQPPVQPTRLDMRGETSRGNKSAQLAIVEYSDFECPYCGQFAR
jgi:protein-disulfide isomerase